MAAAPSTAELEALKAAAEGQQCRRAPPLAGNDPKRRKTDGQQRPGDGDDEDQAEGAVGRFSYAAADAIAAGSTCLLASCGFNRQRSAAKELLSIVKPLLPEGTQLQMVKVGCRGLAVVRLDPAAPVMPLLGQILDQIQSGALKHTKFIERVIPAETTCLLTSVALEAALTKAATAYLASLKQHEQPQEGGGAGGDGSADAAQQQQQQQQQPVEFAVLYKSRGVDKQILAEMEQEAVAQQQKEQQQKGQQQEAPTEGGNGAQQPGQQPETGAPAAAAGAQGLDRQRVIELAAAVMDKCCKELGGAKVNLSKPQVVVMVEVVPLLRQQTACAVAMLPSSVMSTSHKLKIKPTSAVECSKEGGGQEKKKQAQQQTQQPAKQSS